MVQGCHLPWASGPSCLPIHPWPWGFQAEKRRRRITRVATLPLKIWGQRRSEDALVIKMIYIGFGTPGPTHLENSGVIFKVKQQLLSHFNFFCGDSLGVSKRKCWLKRFRCSPMRLLDCNGLHAKLQL